MLGDGSQFGIHLSYKVHPSPDGLAQAFILGEEFLNGEAGAMVLGDNIFYGNGSVRFLTTAVEDAEENNRATVFGYYVPDPERLGVVAFDGNGHATSMEEKPAEPKSNYAVTGLYFYPAGVSAKAKEVKRHGTAKTKIWKEGKKYLQLSTDEVYGALGAEGYFMETTPINPHSPYSSSKASADHFVKAFLDTYGMPINITRSSNNYGPYQFPEKLIPLMINNVKHHKQLPVYGDGTQIKDWLYVEDHCKAIDMVANGGKIGEVYNVWWPQ